METRILKIRGRTEAAAAARLAATSRWMKAGGWHLVDYSAETGSALYDRDPDAPPLGWLDPTRWAPGPAWWHPAALLPLGGLSWPKALILLLAIAVVGTVFLGLWLETRLGLPGAQETAEEQWRVVTADALNVREGPSTSSQVVGVLYRNQRVLVRSGTKGWFQVVHPVRGYAAANYLEAEPPP